MNDQQPSASEQEQAPVRPLLRVGPFMRPYLGTVWCAAGALAVAAAATLTLPVAVRHMIDQGFAPDQTADVDRHFLALMIVAAVLAGATALRFYFITRLGERVVADIRGAVYAHVLQLSPAFFESTRTGDLLSRITTDTTVLQALIGSGVSVALRNVVLLVGGLVMLAITSPGLFALIIVLVPVVLAPMLAFGRRVRRLSRDSQDRIADTSALAAETLNAMQTVQAYSREDEESRRFSDTVEHAFATAVQRVRARAILTAIIIMLTFGAIILVLWLGAHAVLAGRMTAGELGQFVLYAVLLAGSAAALSEVWGEVQRAAGAMERVTELLDTVPAIAAPSAPLVLPATTRGELRFERVTFAYPSLPERPALTDFDLGIEPGETVALVGPSGAGKSSVLKLILRFYDPTSGRVLLDGIDVASLDPRDLRRRIAMVPQDTVTFGADALANIRYGRLDASDDEVRAAAVAAHAHEFIEQLPDGYHTYLGERGVRLSGGQQQRITLARAILRDSPVLLLDEATSSLDAESERYIQDALERLLANRTTLIIAHRLATVLKADRLVVMEHGRIVDQGTHAQLLERCSLYARLAALQFTTPNETLAGEPAGSR